MVGGIRQEVWGKLLLSVGVMPNVQALTPGFLVAGIIDNMSKCDWLGGIWVMIYGGTDTDQSELRRTRKTGSNPMRLNFATVPLFEKRTADTFSLSGRSKNPE